MTVLPGFGTYRLKGETCYTMVKAALKNGVRYIDTASLYRNQKYVGRAIKDFLDEHPNVFREDIFLSTKVSKAAIATKQIEKDLCKSIADLGTYADLVLLHAPLGTDAELESNWKIMERLFRTMPAQVRSIGVSNYNIAHLNAILKTASVFPAVNQIETSPFWVRSNLTEFCHQHGIKVVAHSSLTKGAKLNDSILEAVAAKYNVLGSQVMLKWGIQKGYTVIPKCSSEQRLIVNCSLDFTLSDYDMKLLDSLDCCFATHPQYL